MYISENDSIVCCHLMLMSLIILVIRIGSDFIINHQKFNKLTTAIFHGLHSYRPEKWCHKMFKTQVEPQASGFTAKFWTFYGIISMIYKSVDHGKFVFYNNIYFFEKNQKQNSRRCVTCYVSSMVYSLIDHSSWPITARGFTQLL